MCGNVCSAPSHFILLTDFTSVCVDSSVDSFHVLYWFVYTCCLLIFTHNLHVICMYLHKTIGSMSVTPNGGIVRSRITRLIIENSTLEICNSSQDSEIQTQNSRFRTQQLRSPGSKCKFTIIFAYTIIDGWDEAYLRNFSNLKNNCAFMY